ncbi:hypothetical protein [Streptomyces sp. NPDC005953]|uniref:hypothetical protein n=1 Tax=Streptomyces sp. NPDC005953 TaxID=3156719 RepID=UPI0033D8E8C4
MALLEGFEGGAIGAEHIGNQDQAAGLSLRSLPGQPAGDVSITAVAKGAIDQ